MRGMSDSLPEMGHWQGLTAADIRICYNVSNREMMQSEGGKGRCGKRRGKTVSGYRFGIHRAVFHLRPQSVEINGA